VVDDDGDGIKWQKSDQDMRSLKHAVNGGANPLVAFECHTRPFRIRPDASASIKATAQLAIGESPNKDKAMYFVRRKRYLIANQVVLG
jgi:hypothetical protein